MAHSIRALGLWAVLAACGPLTSGTYRGAPLLTLRGVLVEAEGRQITGPVRLALVWYARSTSSALSATPFGALYGEPYPQHFAAQLFSLPPSGVLEVLRQGESVAADAVLVAYRDGNGNGVLDLTTAGQPTPDAVLGSSQPTTGEGHRLVYVEGTPPDEPRGLQAGYNLVHATRGVVAFSTTIKMTMTEELALQALICASTEPCSVAARHLTLTGSLGVASGIGAADISIHDASGAVQDAALTVNGQPVPYDGTRRRYSSQQSPNNFVRTGAVNEVRVTGPGYADWEAQVTMPSLFEITTPIFDAPLTSGQPVEVRWTDSTSNAEYRVTIYNQSFQKIYEGTTRTNALITAPISFTGTANITVEARLLGGAMLPNDSFLFPYVNASVPVRFF